MARSRLKLLRLSVGCAVLAALTVAFADIRGSLPVAVVHWLGAVQFVPVWVSLTVTSTAVVTFVALVAITGLGGRIYCSTVCPLGLLQDAVARVFGWVRRSRGALPFVRGSRWVRYGMLGATVLTILLGAESIAYTHADPYSNFGRIVSALLRPVVALTNNALVPFASALGWNRLNQATVSWPTPGILVSAVVVLLLVTLLAAWRGRLFCNTLCPVGTLLGLVARGSAWRLTIDRTACRKCARCLRGCKAQCIDLRTGTIDASRCVSCFNCRDACDEHAVHYQWHWSRARRPSAPVPHPPVAPLDSGRRAFVSGLGVATVGLAGGAALISVARATDASAGRPEHRPDRSGAICPPGAGSRDRFLDRCTACNLCVSACPTHVLRPAFLEYGFAGMMKPRLDYSTSFCNFDCHRCSDVCPDGALTPLDLAAKHLARIGEARLDIELCIVKTNGTDCAACSEHCPTKALDTKPYGQNLRLPFLQVESCIGCGACEFACPAAPEKAVRVFALRQHGVAQPLDSGAAAAPPPSSGDFPF